MSKKISKIVLEKQKEGKVCVNAYYDNEDYNHVFDIINVDGYLLLVDVASNKTIKVFESHQLLIEHLEQYADGAKIVLI